MKTPYEIVTTLLLNSRHAPQVSYKDLPEATHSAYGFDHYIPSSEYWPDFPEWLSTIFEIAAGLGCSHLRFDEDGLVYDSLPTFDV